MALGKLDPVRVGPAALRLREGVEVLLDAYRYACMDTAELLREVRELDSSRPDRAPLAPMIVASLRFSRGNTLVSLDALLDALSVMDTTGGRVTVNLAPAVNIVRGDRTRLKQAMDSEAELARRISDPNGK
jgi:hypothetical protein